MGYHFYIYLWPVLVTDEQNLPINTQYHHEKSDDFIGMHADALRDTGIGLRISRIRGQRREDSGEIPRQPP